MSTQSRRRIPLPGRILAGLIVVAIVATALATWAASSAATKVTAYFVSSVGLYTGDRVMIRGVPVGAVDTIEPIGDQVKISLHFDSEHGVDADSRAVIVAPTLVSGRYIQLTSVSDAGPKLADGAEIPLERTAVPVEYDQVKKQVADLATDLGPKDGNEGGALSRIADATTKALGGNGKTLKESLINLSAAMRTLADGGPDLFGTVRNLQTVVSALAANDSEIEIFASQLGGASKLLNDNRTELDAAVAALDSMLPEIQKFVGDNRGALTKDVSSLTRITNLLVNRVDDLAQILHGAPTALADLYNIYDPDSNSLTANIEIADYPDPMSMICALLTTVDAPQQECTRASENFGDLFSAAVRAAQGGGSGPPATAPALSPTVAPGLPELFTPGGGR
ncbi:MULTISPECIES: MCE family protein [Rhodococcus]|uniref:MCE family protein n=1 Tax=Rhodococcus TaxID=1827 RepID=UPI0007182F7E|nr:MULTISPECIES: MCE family protein [Rhodococcus]MCZ4618696.1 MCE family protein [Rhodococcus qingshengii]MEA1798470.1 MCE family protein [Rhodococcus qingshengii]ORI28805.1 mammalian cell entry protein [Rhodococcus erythropolis]